MKSIITKINELSRQQLEIINEEKEHRDKMKNYFIYHTQGSLKLIKHQYETLQKFITDLTSNRSEEKSRSIINMCEFNSERFHSHTFPFTRDQLQIASSYLSPWVANKFIDTFAGLGSTFYSITQDPSLLERTSSLGDIDKSIKNQIQTIDDCTNRLNEEKAGQ
jgi:rubrerythrin